MPMVIHLLHGSGVCCIPETPMRSAYALNPDLVTCKRCKKTKVFRMLAAHKKAKRARNGMKQQELFEGVSK